LHKYAFAIICAMEKIRLTSARKAILDELENYQTHLTANQIHENLVERLPSINLSTVYRSLEYLVDHDLVSISDMGVGSPVYERKQDEPHHHLVCLNCKSISDLSDEIVQPFFNQVEHKYHMELRTSHLILFGICEHCKED
jgi:Fur family ferric uptake transcriptional regulator